MKTITVGNAVATINDSARDFSNGLPLSDEAVETIVFASNNEIQIRDYLVGLPLDYPLETCISFLKYISSRANSKDTYALDTVEAMLQYESGNIARANQLLDIVQEFKSDYSLAHLMRRVIQAGWSSDSVADMRNHLAPSVVEILNEMTDKEIEVAE